MKNDMLRLLYKSVLGVLVFAVINVCIYLTSPFFERQRSYHDQIESYFDQHAEVVIVGDSHPGVFNNAMLNQKSYNLSAGGDGFKECYLKLRYILERSEKVKAVLLTADAQMFSTRRSCSTNAAFLHPYALTLNALDVYHKKPVPVLAEMAPLFNDSYIGYLNTYLQNIITGNQKSADLEQAMRDDKSLWCNQFTAAQRIKKAAETGRKDHAGVMDDNTLSEYYLKIIDLCVARNIRLIGIRFPAMQAYFEQLAPENRTTYENFLKRLPFEKSLDYRTFSQDPHLFEDEDHLNQEGARRLLRQIEKDTGLELEG
jgi:hypothetical protein